MKAKSLSLVFIGVTASQLFAMLVAYLSKPISVVSVNTNGSVSIYANDTVEQVAPSNLTSHMVVQVISPFGLGPLGSLLVSASLVVGSLLAAFLMVLALRKGYINYVVAGVLGAATFTLNYYIVSYAFGYLSVAPLLTATVLAAFMVFYALRPLRFKGWLAVLANAVVLLNGAELGLFLAVSFQRMTIIFLAFVFSAYDFYSVFRGPISKMLGRPTSRPGPGPEEAVERPERNLLGPMLVNFGEVEMGLGDITFYSMMPAAIFTEGMGLGAAIVEVLLIDVGIAATLALLRKVRPLPGLPIPLLLGLLGFLLP